MEFVRVPAGEFQMGTTPEQAQAVIKSGGKDWKRWVAWEHPQHRVYLDEYLIGKYPVTVAPFAAFVEATGYKTAGSAIKSGKENHPVTEVRWDDAAAFCEWASKVTGRTVRLPTEAEWEKAARGAEGRVYPWGDTFDKNRLNSSEGGKGDTTLVASYPGGVSPYGAFDMAGNVWEWCADWFDENYYTSSPRENPKGSSSALYRVRRGGSWYFDTRNVRAANRDRDYPVYCPYHVGFRCAV